MRLCTVRDFWTPCNKCGGLQEDPRHKWSTWWSPYEPAHEIMVLNYQTGNQPRLRWACASAQLPEPSLFAHMKYGSRRRIRPKIRHLARHVWRMSLRRTKSVIISRSSGMATTILYKTVKGESDNTKEWTGMEFADSLKDGKVLFQPHLW